MKALIISSLLFFSLRAMSSESEVGENKKTPCPYSVQTDKREAKDESVQGEVNLGVPAPQVEAVIGV